MSAKRVSLDHLEAMAFDAHRLIEFDLDNDLAFCKIGAVEYVATVPPPPPVKLAAPDGAA